MLELILTSFCLVISFVINDKKKRIKSIVQLILCFILMSIVLFILPNAPLSYIIEKKLGVGSIAIIQDVITSFDPLNFSIIKMITFAIIFVTLL